MKVLLFIEPAWISRYWLEAVPMLKAQGIDAGFVTLRKSGELNKALAALGVEVFALGAERALDYPSAARRLSQIVRQHSFEMVHASEPIPAAVSCAAGWFGARHTRLYHRHHYLCPPTTRTFDILAAKFSDAIMACSNSVRAAAEREGFPPDRICVAYNGIQSLREVPAREAAQLREEHGIPQVAIVISQIARLSEEKGQLTLIQAAGLLAAEVSRPIHLIFAGAGRLEPAIREAAEKTPDITVHLVGHQADVAPWFAIADVNVMPSYTEAFGIAAAEAMASGKPLVASAVGGLTEVVEDGVSGILVPPRDAEALAKSILQILESPGLAERLGRAGIARVAEKFTTGKMVRGWIDCYNWAFGLGR